MLTELRLDGNTIPADAMAAVERALADRYSDGDGDGDGDAAAAGGGEAGPARAPVLSLQEDPTARARSPSDVKSGRSCESASEAVARCTRAAAAAAFLSRTGAARI